MQSNFAQSMNKAWYSTTQDYKLDVLRNDKIVGASLDSCIEQEVQVHADKTFIEFQDIAQVIVLSFDSYFFFIFSGKQFHWKLIIFHLNQI